MRRLHLLRPDMHDHRTFCNRDTSTSAVEWILDRRKLERSNRACQRCLAESKPDVVAIDHASKELDKIERLNRLSRNGQKVKPTGRLERLIIKRLSEQDNPTSSTALSFLIKSKVSELKIPLESLWNKGIVRKFKKGWLLAD